MKSPFLRLLLSVAVLIAASTALAARKPELPEFTEDGGFAVVDEAGKDVLLVRPAIVNLDVKAPDTRSAGMTKTCTDSAGEMTLYLELHDSVTADLTNPN